MKKKPLNPEIVVKTYVELVKKLKSFEINPQEAFNLAYRNKYHLNARYYWTRIKITRYLRVRIKEYVSVNRHLRSKYKDKSSDFIRDKVKNEMPKKIKSCWKTVDNEYFKKTFDKYNPKAKWDVRKEVQNLHKLVTERRREKDKFDSKLHRPIYEEFNRTAIQNKVTWNYSIFQKLINIIR